MNAYKYYNTDDILIHHQYACAASTVSTVRRHTGQVEIEINANASPPWWLQEQVAASRLCAAEGQALGVASVVGSRLST